MPIDYFIWFDKIEGTSTDEHFKGAFEIKDWSFGVENPTTIGSATGGAGSGKAKFNEFTIKKTTDQASPLFFRSCAAGTHFPKIELFCRKAGGEAENNVFMKIHMSDVLISSYQNAVPPSPINPVLGDTVPVLSTNDVIVIAPTGGGDPLD